MHLAFLLNPRHLQLLLLSDGGGFHCFLLSQPRFLNGLLLLKLMRFNLARLLRLVGSDCLALLFLSELKPPFYLQRLRFGLLFALLDLKFRFEPVFLAFDLVFVLNARGLRLPVLHLLLDSLDGDNVKPIVLIKRVKRCLVQVRHGDAFKLEPVLLKIIATSLLNLVRKFLAFLVQFLQVHRCGDASQDTY